MFQELKSVKIGGKSYKIKYEKKMPRQFYPAYYDTRDKKIHIQDGLDEKEWILAMIHEIQEIITHEVFQPALEQLYDNGVGG